MWCLWKHCYDGCLKPRGRSPQPLVRLRVAVSWFFPHSSGDFSGYYYDGRFTLYPGHVGYYVRDSEVFLSFFFNQTVALLKFGTQVQAYFCGLRFQWQFNLSLVSTSAQQRGLPGQVLVSQVPGGDLWVMDISLYLDGGFTITHAYYIHQNLSNHTPYICAVYWMSLMPQQCCLNTAWLSG